MQELALYADYLERSTSLVFDISIQFDYHPYARADRRFNDNEPSCLYAFITAIASLLPRLGRVSTVDSHSAVTKELWNTLGVEFTELSQASALAATLPQGTKYMVFSSSR